MTTSWIFTVLVFWILKTEGKSIQFSSSTCLSNYLIDSTSDISLVWDGSPLEEGIFDSCSISFTPVGSSETVCVEVESFHIEDCNVNVNYRDYLLSTETYGCNATPQKYCGGKNDDVTIEISHGMRLLSTSGSNSFRLKIYNPSDVNYVRIIVLVGLALGFIICTLVIIFVCRRKRSAGRVLRPAGIPHTRLVNYPDPAPISSNDQQPDPDFRPYSDPPLHSDPPPYSPQQPETKEYTVTVPVAVNFS
ncbi:uncharacterized protein LOC111105832 [Crassostrea virginica]